MATNQLTSDGIEVGQTLVVAADTPKTTAVASDAIATAQTPAVPAQVQAPNRPLITGAPGSPDAKITIDGRYLPAPPQPFTGQIELNAVQSKPGWPATMVPPKGAPNILLIMTDDVGFAAPSTFGGVIPTPTLDRIANNGLRYTNFHSTSLCSPTRAALITGRNHNSVGVGVIAEQSTGYPGYNSVIGKENATIGRILLDNGYRTSWYGKDHNTPDWVATQAGPFDQWPTGMGFEHFYGFVGGDTSQWQPSLFNDTKAIYPYVDNPTWNLTTAMADDAIHWLNMLNDINPSMPSFFGGTRQGMAVSWPGHITDKGGIRWQFHHVIDIVPTLLEVTGIAAPVMVDGVEQKSIEGVSMA